MMPMTKEFKIIEIKRDIDSWVVYVDGLLHPQGTGFPTRKAAEKWVYENFSADICIESSKEKMMKMIK
jgi:hypothetical protein